MIHRLRGAIFTQGCVMAASFHCRGCGSSRLKEFLNLGNMPLAGGFLRSRDDIAGEQTFPLPIHVCEDCSLVQITQPIDPNILFKDYAFASSTVGPLVTHF